ncbi:MAG: GlsB/YeaQ/YmgE family stress response membrane protein [Chloroflexi bacterium]|nr:GlsB/YeaQ/YmgE family stress response membrane protein [Chloroflexota bacterium]
MPILVLIAILIIGYIVISLLVNATIGIIGLLIPLLIWALIGWLAGKVMSGRGYGAFGNILLGLAGGVVGSFLFNVIGANWGDDGLIARIVVGVVGSIALIVVGRLVGFGKTA